MEETPDEIYKKVREGWEESAKYWDVTMADLLKVLPDKEKESLQNTLKQIAIDNLLGPEDDEDYESPYCEVCKSCGEEGCCSVEKSLLGHNCKYGEWYARDVYFNNVLIDELLTYIKENVAFADEVVDAAYNKAFEMAKEKYDEK